MAGLLAAGCLERPHDDSGTVDSGTGDGTGPAQSRPDPSLECDEPFATPEPRGPGEGADFCVTETITCDAVVRGSNTAGTTHFGADVDEQFGTCAGSASQTSRLAGPERVYALQVPQGIRALSVELDSCARSWLFWYQGPPCAADEVACSYATKGDWYSQNDEILLGEPDVIYFVVESDNDNGGGNFRLSVTCFE